MNLKTTNHRQIGVNYIYFGLCLSIVGSGASGAMRAELATPSTNFMDNTTYNSLVTAHSLLMVFFFVMPYLISSFSNMMIPLNACTPDMQYSRLNNWSFCMMTPSCLFVLCSLSNMTISVSWTVYAPLSTFLKNVDYYIFSLYFASASSIVSSINFLMTLTLNSPKSSTFYSSPIFNWTYYVVSLMLASTLPVLIAALTMLLTDRHMNSLFFESGQSSDALLFQHMFWFFSHPEVYVLILPSFSILTHLVVWCNANNIPWAFYAMVWCTVLISVISFVVWGHHMYMSSYNTDTKTYFSISTIVISIPTSIKVFTWSHQCTLKSSYMIIPLYWAFNFLWLFTISSCTSLILSNASTDATLHDTYFVVAHFHYVLSMGATVGLIMSTYFYFPLLVSFISERITAVKSMYSFTLSINCVFMPMHNLGLESMPRRYCNYNKVFTNLNRFISVALAFTFSFTSLLLFSLSSSFQKLRVYNAPQVKTTEFCQSVPAIHHTWSESPLVAQIPNHYNPWEEELPSCFKNLKNN